MGNLLGFPCRRDTRGVRKSGDCRTSGYLLGHGLPAPCHIVPVGERFCDLELTQTKSLDTCLEVDFTDDPPNRHRRPDTAGWRPHLTGHHRFLVAYTLNVPCSAACTVQQHGGPSLILGPDWDFPSHQTGQAGLDRPLSGSPVYRPKPGPRSQCASLMLPFWRLPVLPSPRPVC